MYIVYVVYVVHVVCVLVCSVCMCMCARLCVCVCTCVRVFVRACACECVNVRACLCVYCQGGHKAHVVPIAKETRARSGTLLLTGPRSCLMNRGNFTMTSVQVMMVFAN